MPALSLAASWAGTLQPDRNGLNRRLTQCAGAGSVSVSDASFL
ncbi:hypothetical protein BJ928_11194 [Rhizobium sp. WW_1]|jgi:hypothetical protein|nr:hypothetical protein BJ928_11194 [Rhizobium sp. WW_1]